MLLTSKSAGRAFRLLRPPGAVFFLTSATIPKKDCRWLGAWSGSEW